MCMKVDSGRIGACSRHVFCGEVVRVSYLCCPEFAACFEQGFSRDDPDENCINWC